MCVKIADVQPGDVLIADDGFDCLHNGQECEVFMDPEYEGVASLYVKCSQGEHYLEGQIGYGDDDHGDEFVGFNKKAEQ